MAGGQGGSYSGKLRSTPSEVRRYTYMKKLDLFLFSGHSAPRQAAPQD
jgi:hypothetical protein